MSNKRNLIRKARNQLHSVREDGLRRQLNAVKGIKRSSGSHHHGTTTTNTPGFKFSDIDNTDMDDLDWIESADTSNTAPSSSSGEMTRSTSDYSSSYSSMDSSYSNNNQQQQLFTSSDSTSDSISTTDPLTSSRDPLDDGLHTRQAWDSIPSSSRVMKPSSLFDDVPSLEEDNEDLFDFMKPSDPLFDPSPQVPVRTVDDLFQTPPVSEDTSDDIDESTKNNNSGEGNVQEHHESLDSMRLNTAAIETQPNNDDDINLLGTDLIDKQITNKSSKDEAHTNQVSISEVPTNEVPTIEIHPDEVSTNKQSNEVSDNDVPINEVSTNELSTNEVSTNEVPTNGQDLVNRPPINDDDDLFMSVTSDLLVPPLTGESPNDAKSDLNSSFSSNLAMSETSEDPLSLMMSHDLEDDDDDVTDPARHDNDSTTNDSLLPVNEQYFTTPDHTPTLNHTPLKPSTIKPHPSTPPTRASPLSIHKSQKDSPRTQMKKNSSGKTVPVVPPRPRAVSKRTVSCPDPDTVSLVSNVSSISAYSANEVFNRRDIPVDDSITSQGSQLRPWLLDSIDEVAPAADHESSTTIDSGYTMFILVMSWLVLYVYYSLNPFVYLAGFMAGFFTFYITIGTAFYWYVQYSEREKERRESANKKVELPAMEDLPKTIDTDFESSRILESKKFGMVHQYYPTTHHPSQRVNTKVKLYDDFMMEIRYWSEVHTPEGQVAKEVVISKDLRTCSILIVPEEVAQNRKRRWSKKFPISVSWDRSEDSTFSQVFLFTFTSREKEEWFRRLRSAQEGRLYDDIIREQSVFFRYMGKYMPHSTSPVQEPAHTTRTHHKRVTPTETKSHISQRTRGSTHGHHKPKLASEPVRFSMTTANEEDDDDMDTISLASSDAGSVISLQKGTSITKQPPPPPVSGNASSNVQLSSSLNYGWMNAGLARLAWDMWHEERWLKWVQSRIQRKLIRIKTPSFMEPLKVTEVDMGMDMPIVKRPFKNPKLDSRGIWIYMEVEYRGTFNMTIETKLKLEPKLFGAKNIMHFNRGSESPPPTSSHSSSPVPDHHGNRPHPYHKSRLSRLKVNTGDPEEELSSGSDDEESISSQVTRSMEEKLPHDLEQQGIPVYSLPQDDSGISSTSSSSSSVTSSNEFNSTAGPKGRKEKILTNMVSHLQKIATKSKLVAKAAEKVSSYPMILSVEVKSLKGFLVLNMAPPPSDALWFGFTVNPVLDLVAKPKLGHREVTLSYVTDWIEKKLCDVLEKKLVYPNMEDLVIPVLNSGLPEDKIIDLMTPPS